MSVTVLTPAEPQLTLEEMRLQCRLTAIGGTHVEDSLLEDILADAMQYAQHLTQQSIGEQTLELALDWFPDGSIELPMGPVQSVTSVKYIDAEGVEQTLDDESYVVDLASFPQKIDLAYGVEWPGTQNVPNAVKVVYVAGVQASGSVKQALKLYLSNDYDNGRGGGNQKLYEETLKAVDTKLHTIKRWGF